MELICFYNSWLTFWNISMLTYCFSSIIIWFCLRKAKEVVLLSLFFKGSVLMVKSINNRPTGFTSLFFGTWGFNTLNDFYYRVRIFYPTCLTPTLPIYSLLLVADIIDVIGGAPSPIKKWSRNETKSALPLSQISNLLTVPYGI